MIGVVFPSIIPWVGIPVGAVGLLLAVLYLVGCRRRGSEAQTQP